LENPNYPVKVIEVCHKDGTGAPKGKTYELDIALKEFYEEGGSEADIRYVDGNRFVSGFTEVDPSTFAGDRVSLRENGVYIITGGMGGLGLVFARYIAKKVKANLVLVGRSRLDDEKNKKITELKALGSEVIYIEGDVSKREDVEAVVKEAKARFNAIHGVLHCAGVLRDSFILKKFKNEMNEVLGPKVLGTVLLDRETKDEGMDFFVLFSSISAFMGNIGQSDYAYGNSFMDHYAVRISKRREPCKVISIDWPLWAEGGMKLSSDSAVLVSRSERLETLSSEDGIAVFENALNFPDAQLIAFSGDKNGTYGKKAESPDVKPEVPEAPIMGKNALETKDDARVKIEAESLLKDIIAGQVKIHRDRIELETPFESYGIDSIMIISLTRELEKHFGELSKTLFFEYQNLNQLTEYFVENYKEKILEITGHTSRTGLLAPNAALEEKRPESKGGRFLRDSMKREAAIKERQEKRDRALEDIAIIGLDGRYPKAGNLKEFWENISSGRDCIIEIPDDRWDNSKYYSQDKNRPGKIHTKWGGFIDDVDKFDPLFFNISPREAEFMDPQERLFMEITWNAIEDAGYSKTSLNGQNIGVFVGVMWGQYQLFSYEFDGSIISGGSSYASIANRISYYFNFFGPSMAVDTMCSSSLTAISLACDSIHKGESSMAIAGGVNVSIHQNKYALISQGKFTASDGKCHSFGEGGDGYVPGEGVGAVVLKPISRAIADGDQIYAVIKASALNHGGKTNGFTVPNPNAQGNVIMEALKRSGVHPRTISYLEAHGTGTSLGDPIEITGLVKAFGNYTREKQFCPIGSVKSNIGHLESAAGIAALTKVLLQMKHNQLAPSINSEKTNPNIKFENTPFYVQHCLEEWKQPVVNIDGKVSVYPRRAGLSSFGAGGSNAHIILEEYDGNTHSSGEETGEPRLIILSAKNEERLKAYCLALKEHLESEWAQKGSSLSLLNVSYTLQVGREPMEERLAVIVSNVSDAIHKLESWCSGETRVNDLYRGNVKTDGLKSRLLVEGASGEIFVKSVIKDKEISKLAQLWVMGVDVDWNLLYKQVRPQRVSLPTYPFSKSRCWLPDTVETEFKGTLQKGGTAALHPVVDSNISTLEEQCFNKILTGTEFYLRDHVLGEKAVLPGTVYIEMARAAGTLARRNVSVRGISNIIWAKPITFTKEPVEVCISLRPNAGNVSFEISTAGEDSQRLIHSQGSILYENDTEDVGSVENIDINSIKSRCHSLKNEEQLYSEFYAMGFKYGTSFRVIREVRGNGGEAIAFLELPSELEDEVSQYVLHPSLMDGALQTLSGLLTSYDGNPEQMYLPFSIGSIEIFRPLTSRCYAYAVPANTGNADGNGIKKYDILLADETGLGLVKIKDYSLKAAASGKVSLISGGMQASTVSKYLVPVWEKAENVLRLDSGKARGKVVVFDTGETFVEAFKDKTGKVWDGVVLVKPGSEFVKRNRDFYEIDPSDKDHYLNLLEEMKKDGDIPLYYVHMWSEDSFCNRKEALDLQLAKGVYSLLYLSQALMAQKLKNNIKVLYVSTSGRSEIKPLNNAVGGFAKSIGAENPNMVFKTLEIRSSHLDKPSDFLIQSVGYVSDELSDDDNAVMEVLYDNGIRNKKHLKDYSTDRTVTSESFKDGGVYLITGGAGGLGLAFARYISEKVKARIILAGRSSLGRDRISEIEELAGKGSEITYMRADVTSPSDVEKLISQIKSSYGELNGVIHCAGVLRDSFAIKKTREEMDMVLAPKIFGTVYLDEATKGEKLDFFILFSSITSVMGNIGQCDYAYANGFMDSYAQWRSMNGRQGKSISFNWPLWEEGGMTVSNEVVELMRKTAGLAVLKNAAGFEAFRTGMGSEVNQFMVIEALDKGSNVVAVKESPIKENPVKAVNTERPLSEGNGASQLQSENNGASQLRERAELHLKKVISKVMRIPVDKIRSEEPFELYGLDSIGIMGLTG
ncbi:MAG: SDR family NAD(P)-dependent oxidoreductase, partial [Bacillota bacterium]|nr:SDR family NAD(P)-dependent oxidoreductase [Bacillota bacterium]